MKKDLFFVLMVLLYSGLVLFSVNYFLFEAPKCVNRFCLLVDLLILAMVLLVGLFLHKFFFGNKKIEKKALFKPKNLLSDYKKMF